MPNSVRSGPAAVPAVKPREGGGGQHHVRRRRGAPRRGRRAGPGGWVASPGAPGCWRSEWDALVADRVQPGAGRGRFGRQPGTGVR